MPINHPFQLFLQAIKKIRDPRSKRGITHDFHSILAILFLGLLANVSTLAETNAISQIAKRTSSTELAERFGKEAERIRKLLHEKLWDEDAKSHHREREDGKMVSWIDENLNPDTGDWISRTRLKTWKNGTWDAGKGGVERGKDYNHSTFCDLIINGLIGFHPSLDSGFTVYPLLPADIDYFALDGIRYHGKTITILYDKTGERYHRGKGFSVDVDGIEVFRSETLPERRVSIKKIFIVVLVITEQIV